MNIAATLPRFRHLYASLPTIMLAAACHHAAPPAVEMTTAAPPHVGRQSWTTDDRAFAIGDILLVNVDEFTLASANSGSSASSKRDRDASFRLAAAMKGKVVTDADLSLGVGNEARSSQNGQSTRQNRFSSQIAVRVVGFGPSGMLYVRGRKTVAIDRANQEVVLSGWVRPSDVQGGNLVLSSRIADAELAYASRGSLDHPEGGTISRLLGWLWP